LIFILTSKNTNFLLAKSTCHLRPDIQIPAANHNLE